MRVFLFESKQRLPCPRNEVFPFFADPKNLEILTPPWLNFTILSVPPLKMEVGSLIDYKLRLHSIPMRWQSEITVWEPPSRFVDEQRRGPYRKWNHEHRFEEVEEGTLCHDLLRYSVPGGRLINCLFVRRDLKKIFAFRASKLFALFGLFGRDFNENSTRAH